MRLSVDRARALILAVAVAATAGIVAVVPHHASATSLVYWTGYTRNISDGDTVYVDITGDHTTTPIPIRNLNIQATEMHGANGKPECHAQDATNMMAKLLPYNTHVRIAAYHPSSTAGVDPKGLTRLLRYVDAYNPATHAYDIDVQMRLIQAGLVMPESIAGENARYQTYMVAAQKAMGTHVGLFSPNTCGVGPYALAPLWIHYDGDGVEGSAPNMEWIHMRNIATTDLKLAGWHLRNASHTWYHGTTYYTFPSYAHIAPGQTISIYPGAGADNPTAGRYYLNITQGSFFPNVSNPALADPGYQMYLLDPQLDFRGWAVYSCFYACSHPRAHISHVQGTTGDEYVDITPDAGVTTPVDLTAVEVTNDGWTRELNPGTILNPGETLRVYCERTGADDRLHQHWNHTGGTMLEDAGDTVVLRTAQGTVLSSYSWGTG